MAFYKSIISQITLYKYRYFVGYSAVVALLLTVLLVDINSIPNGISEPEMTSAVTSMHLNPNLSLDWIVNAPHHLLQQLSINLLGLSRVSLVAPSLFFGILTIILFNMTIRRWFSRSISIISTIITSTTASFMILARGGTPDIMLAFWTVLFIFAGVSFLVNHERGFRWKILIVLAGVGLLYTPYGIYTLLACLLGGLVHPHVRSRLKRVKPVRLAILIGLGLVSLIPLVIYALQQPSSLALLTGLDQLPQSIDQLRTHLANIVGLYLDFTNSRVVDTFLTPVFNIASIALMLFGLFRLIQKHHTARSYVMLTWLATTGLVLILISQSPHIALMPAMFLLAFGIKALIEEWYTLFPRNPYARFAGLLPLGVLLVGISTSNLMHYFNLFRYMPTPAYSASLSAVKQSVKLEGNRAVTVVTSEATKQFYEILKTNYPQLTVTSTLPPQITQPTLVLPNIASSYPDKSPSRVFVTWNRENNVVLRVYRP